MNNKPTDFIKKLDVSPAAQEKRRALIADLVYKATLPTLRRHKKGKPLEGGYNTGDTRMPVWLAESLLVGGKERRKLANELLENSQFPQSDHFTSIASAALLNRHPELLTPAVKKHLENYLLRYLGDSMTEDYRFHGANDNAPLGTNGTLTLAGQYFKRPAFVDFARERFRRLNRLLDLRGYIHECNSPTYIGISLMNLAMVAELCTDKETQAMALRAEQRLWQELFLHFHPVIGHQMGPFSRGYQDDNANQCTNAMMVLYSGCGEISPFNPLRMLFPPPEGTFGHNDWMFQWTACGGTSSPTYHPPKELAERSLKRETPFSVFGSNEYMPINFAPCGETSLQVYGEREWGLSSFGSRPWAGQTVALHALYQRHEVANDAKITQRLEATRSVYTRMHISENFATALPRNAVNADKEVYLDHASAFVVQHQGTALLGYVPLLGPEKVRTMKTSVVFPLHHSRPDEIWHGRRQLASFSAAYAEVDWAFVRDGDIYLAFYPLIAKQCDAQLCTQQYADYGNYGLISFYNMSAFTERPMSALEQRSYGGGLIMEISSKRLEGTFEKFRDKIAKAKISQRQYGCQRDLLYSRAGVELELMYDFEQLNLRRAAANGALVSRTVKLETQPALPLVR